MFQEIWQDYPPLTPTGELAMQIAEAYKITHLFPFRTKVPHFIGVFHASAITLDWDKGEERLQEVVEEIKTGNFLPSNVTDNYIFSSPSLFSTQGMKLLKFMKRQVKSGKTIKRLSVSEGEVYHTLTFNNRPRQVPAHIPYSDASRSIVYLSNAGVLQSVGFSHPLHTILG